jgi:hypothetical protein
VGRGTQLRQIAADPAYVHAVAFSPDGSEIASAGQVEGTRVWDPVTGKAVTQNAAQRDVFSLAFSPKGQALASGDLDGGIQVASAPPRPADIDRLGANERPAPQRTRAAAPNAADRPANQDADKDTDNATALRNASNEAMANVTAALRGLNPGYAIAPVQSFAGATAGMGFRRLPYGERTVVLGPAGQIRSFYAAPGTERVSGIEQLPGFVPAGVVRRGACGPFGSIATFNLSSVAPSTRSRQPMISGPERGPSPTEVGPTPKETRPPKGGAPKGPVSD